MSNFNSLMQYALEDIDDPANLIPLFIVLICFSWSGLPRGKSKWMACWVLFNGTLIHIWMEGIIGVWSRGPKWMVDQYKKLDSRYPSDPTVRAIVAAEVFLMGPLSIIWYNGIVKEKWYRHPVAIVVSCFQMCGAIIFVLHEIQHGFKHLPLDNWPPSFTTWNDVFYFWIIFVFCNIIWTGIPTLCIIRSTLAFKKNDEKKKK